MEIERKWLLNSLPSLNLIEEGYAEQIYLSVNPEVRARMYVAPAARAKENCTLTIKGEGTLSREEIECTIPFGFYRDIKLFLNKPPIVKKVYIFTLDKYELTVSDVDSKFLYAEIEFNSLEEANSFVLPIEDAKEVTKDPSYKMKNYWKKTRL